MAELALKLKDSVAICDNGPWMLPESTEVPTGAENGTVLVMGIGGSTLRLSLVTVTSMLARTELLKQTLIPNDVKLTGNLFNWSVSQVLPLIYDISSQFNGLTLAVSWSFPLIRGETVCMGKSFGHKYDNVDVKSAFNEILPEEFKVSSVTHDGTSSLIAGIHQFPNCCMALTLGTGVNINLRLRNDQLVNTEVSMLGREDTTPGISLPKLSFDITDSRSGFQPLETQVGGLYLSELVSNAVGESVNTLDLWRILEERDDFRYNSVLKIVDRAAGLVAAAVYGLLLYRLKGCSVVDTDSSPAIVAYTGGVIFEPQFRELLDQKMESLNNVFSLKVELVPQKYGSEVGAAISALTVVSRAGN